MQVERWGIFELALTTVSSGTRNPFTDVRFGATFTFGHRAVSVDGFYDGDGIYKVRFMPDSEGEWSYTTAGDLPELEGQRGTFTCTPPSENNHGSVMVRDTFDAGDLIWWSKGGQLRGESMARITFLRQIVENAPCDLEPLGRVTRNGAPTAGREGQYYLSYLGVNQPSALIVNLPEDGQFAAETIDTWAMTITPVEGVFSGRATIPLPARPYLAVRIQRT